MGDRRAHPVGILRAIDGRISVVSVGVVVVVVWDARSVVDQVDAAEVSVVVVVSMLEMFEAGVERSRGAWLFVRVSVGADDEAVRIFVVESIVAADTVLGYKLTMRTYITRFVYPTMK